MEEEGGGAAANGVVAAAAGVVAEQVDGQHAADAPDQLQAPGPLAAAAAAVGGHGPAVEEHDPGVEDEEGGHPHADGQAQLDGDVEGQEGGPAGDDPVPPLQHPHPHLPAAPAPAAIIEEEIEEEVEILVAAAEEHDPGVEHEEGGHQHDDDDAPDQEQVDGEVDGDVEVEEGGPDGDVEVEEGGPAGDDPVPPLPHPHLPAAPPAAPAASIGAVQEKEIEHTEEVLEIVPSATVPASTHTLGEIAVEFLASQPAAQANPPPAAAPTAHHQHQVDYLRFILAGVTTLVLGAVLVAEMGTDISTWNATLGMMTPRGCALAAFVAMGDIISLFLTYAPAWKFWGMWRREGAGVGAGLATMVPPIVGLVNSGVWVFYGAAVPGKNWSVIIVNGVGAAFQAAYATVFCTRSEAAWRPKLLVLMIGAGAGAVIAIFDFLLLHVAFGIAMDSAIGWSGAATTGCTYVYWCVINMSAAARNRGADGVPAQAWASLANAGAWLVVAALAPDWRMLVSNLGGIGCFLAQAGQLVYFRFRRPQLEESSEEALRRRLLEDQV